MKVKITLTLILCATLAAPALAGTIKNVPGNAIGSVSEDSDGDKIYRDRTGNQRGSPSTDSWGETTYRDRNGNIKGTSKTDSSGKKIFKDKNGNQVASLD